MGYPGEKGQVPVTQANAGEKLTPVMQNPATLCVCLHVVVVLSLMK